MKLKDIRDGKITYSQFMSGIEDFVRTEVSAITKIPASELQATLPQACPKCGKQSLTKSFMKIECVNKDFSLWTKIAQKQLTDRQIDDLLTKRETFVSGMKSKAGKTFDSWVVLKPDMTTGFDFTKAAPVTKASSKVHSTKPGATTKATKMTGPKNSKVATTTAKSEPASTPSRPKTRLSL